MSPSVFRVRGRHEELEAVLAGVSGAGDCNCVAQKRRLRATVIAHCAEVGGTTHHALQESERFRSLYGQQRERAILYSNVNCPMLA